MNIWDDKAWEYHLELIRYCYHSGSESGWGWYIDTEREKFVFPKVPRRVTFLHHETGVSFSQLLTPTQIRTLCFSDKLLRDLPFINWLGGL
jgi:hypothetical protein